MEGWISLHRKIQENDLWLCEPFTRGQAWIDLLLLANHESGYFYKRGVKIDLKRGQVGWSELALSNRWKWSRNKVRKFLSELEKEQQIKQQKTNVTQILTLINYDKYQQKDNKQNNRRTTEGQQKDTNNNENNENNENNDNDSVNDIYNYYPSKCSVSNRSTGKSRKKDCKKIEQLLKEYSIDKLKSIIDRYKSECLNTKTYMKNFATFLNNIPDYDESHSSIEDNLRPSLIPNDMVL